LSKKKEKFNVTKGMTLLLLKKVSLPASFVFQLILFITDPETILGIRLIGTKKPALKQVLL